MTTKSVATKAEPSKESKGIPLWIARGAILLVILAVLCLYLQTPSIWIFYKTQNIYGNLIAPLFFFVISLALLRHLWQNRDKKKKDRARRVVWLAVYGFFLVIGFTYSLDPNMSWFFYKLKDQQGNLIALVFFALLLLCGVWWGIENSEEKNRRLYAMEIAAFTALVATDFVYLMKIYAPIFFATIQDKDNFVIAPIFFLLISAPLSLYLWLCRNEDKLKQIDQTDEQNRLNRLSNAMPLFKEAKDQYTKAAGLRILAKIKNESDAFNVEIDTVTSGSYLERADLEDADLANIDLSRANLTRANLAGAKLIKANLSSSILEGTNMDKVDFTDANIEDARIGVYNDDKNKKFSREEIEAYLKQDWKTISSKQKFDDSMHIVLQKDKKTYSLIKKGGKSSDMSDAKSSKISGAGAAESLSVQFEPKTGSLEKKDEKVDSNEGGSPEVSRDDSSGIIKTPQREAAENCCEQGLAKMEKEDFDGAIADFDEAIKLDPSYAPAYRYRGIARLQKRRKEGG